MTGLANPRLARRGVEAVLVAVLAVQAARLLWVLAAPAASMAVAAGGTPARLAAADPAVLTQINPFQGAGVSPPGPALSGASGDLQLFGVRTGRRASAIIGTAGGQQQSYAIGDEVVPGAVLSAVGADYVELSRGGAPVRLELVTLPGPSAGVPPPPPPPSGPAPQAGRGVDPAQLMSELSLRPYDEDGRQIGYAVASRGPLAERIGLGPGDILIAVNEDPLTAELLPQLPQRLSARETVILTVRRGAQTLSIPFQPAR